MEREITRQLEEWRRREPRKPLVVQGVRQCGKTYTVKQFGENHFRKTLYFNFERNPSLGDVFSYNYDISRILRELAVMAGEDGIDLSDTLVFFDEIQECPRAITSLKYFCEEHPEMFLVCAGSLLGPAISHRNISFPVGKVEFLEMYPMSLREFMVASGYGKEVKLIEGYDLTRSVPDDTAQMLSRACRTYYAVGGMPEAVLKWTETHDWEQTDKILDDIMLSYSKDFGKYLSPADALKVGWIWESIPVQLAKENNKFVFSHVKSGKRAADLEDALQWLKLAGLVYLQEMVEHPQLPLAFNADATYFRVFMSDIGLLRRKCGLSGEAVINGSAMFSSFKGALTENFVMTELVKQRLVPYFWRSGNSAEVDFLVEYDERVIPIEAKSESNTKAKSYALYCQRYTPELGVKLSMNNVGDNMVGKTSTYSVPLYLLWRLRAYLR